MRRGQPSARDDTQSSTHTYTQVVMGFFFFLHVCIEIFMSWAIVTLWYYRCQAYASPSVWLVGHLDRSREENGRLATESSSEHGQTNCLVGEKGFWLGATKEFSRNEFFSRPAGFSTQRRISVGLARSTEKFACPYPHNDSLGFSILFPRCTFSLLSPCTPREKCA